MFSLLMTVYRGDRPGHFSQALASIESQLPQVAEVVLVRDGPLTAAHEQAIETARAHLPLREVALECNVGLARALNAGLARCRHEWIFRFDADDLCLPHRAQVQWATIQAAPLDIVGGQIEECEPATMEVTGMRPVPCNDAEIRSFARHRNPFNHMTVCFRKSLVLALGGYPDLSLKEDYALWIKCLAAGARVANVPDIVVRARAGKEMIARRGGMAYAASEIDLQRMLWRHGMKPLYSATLDGMARGAVFAAPPGLRRAVFQHYLRQRSFHS